MTLLRCWYCGEYNCTTTTQCIINLDERRASAWRSLICPDDSGLDSADSSDDEEEPARRLGATEGMSSTPREGQKEGD